MRRGHRSARLTPPLSALFAAARFARGITRVAAVTGVAVLAGAVASGSQETPSIEALSWMAGCWETAPSDGNLYEEVWLAPRGGVMLGVSRTLREGRAVAHEFLRIGEEEGTLVYLADPSGQTPTRFTASEVGDRAVTFVNPEHDFPQTIRYRSETPDVLQARIEGERQGETRGVDFPLRRARCP